MSLSYHSGKAAIDEVGVATLAERYGTPLFVYSATALAERLDVLLAAFARPKYQVCFAVKANSNLSLLQQVFRRGLGADVVSVGELERALLAGVSPENVMFSGVGKRDDEIMRAIELGLKSINVESRAEFERISVIAKSVSKSARIAFRVNPNIDARTHPKISTGMFSNKFGIIEDDVRDLLHLARENPWLKVVGLTCHIGSQITTTSPYFDAAKRMALIADAARSCGHGLEFIDMGGGYGIRYLNENLPEFKEYARVMREGLGDEDIQIVIEPGRSIMGESGYLITRALYQKSTPEKNFLIVDAAMNDLLRPTLYDAYHEIVSETQASSERVFDVVGPICETGDILGEARYLPYGHESGLYIIKNCGAYASAMASQYNSRPRPAEVLVAGTEVKLIREREQLSDIWKLEKACLEQKK